jgi:hypothetical protein
VRLNSNQTKWEFPKASQAFYLKKTLCNLNFLTSPSLSGFSVGLPVAARAPRGFKDPEKEREEEREKSRSFCCLREREREEGKK